MQILIVDDEVYAGEALAALLRMEGHDVTVAHDGEAGIAAGIAARFDVALLDLGIGRPDGFEVAETLRAHYGPDIRLIAYTGFSDPKTKTHAHAKGFDALIVKPASMRTLTAALHDATSEGRPETGHSTSRNTGA